MKREELCDILGDTREEWVRAAHAPAPVRKTTPLTRWSLVAACLCLVVAMALLGVKTYATDRFEKLLTSAETPPDGLYIELMEDWQGDWLGLVNESGYTIRHDWTFILEQYDGTHWQEVTSAGVSMCFLNYVMEPGQRWYIGEFAKEDTREQFEQLISSLSRLIVETDSRWYRNNISMPVEPGCYRYRMPVGVEDPERGFYCTVLELKFELTQPREETEPEDPLRQKLDELGKTRPDGGEH